MYLEVRWCLLLKCVCKNNKQKEQILLTGENTCIIYTRLCECKKNFFIKWRNIKLYVKIAKKLVDEKLCYCRNITFICLQEGYK